MLFFRNFFCLSFFVYIFSPISIIGQSDDVSNSSLDLDLIKISNQDNIAIETDDDDDDDEEDSDNAIEDSFSESVNEAMTKEKSYGSLKQSEESDEEDENDEDDDQEYEE